MARFGLFPGAVRQVQIIGPDTAAISVLAGYIGMLALNQMGMNE